MHEHPVLIVGFLLLALFGLVSKLADRSPITGPMVFLTAGIVIGPAGLEFLKISVEPEAYRLVAEVTLIIILFIDASMIRIVNLRQTLSGIPIRLLAFGLPMTMLLGFVIATLLIPGINLWLAALVALTLAPTDAALGQAVVTSRDVPQRIRQGISIESGLNDGIALPLFLACIAALTEASQSIDTVHWLNFMVLQLALGPVVGGFIGHFGGRLIDKSMARDWMEPTFQSLASICMALLSYVSAEAVGGNGFIAAFFAGMLLGTRTIEVRNRIQAFGEAEGQMLSLFIFMTIGLVGVPAALPYIDAMTILYSLLSLTVIRMLPVAISLIGSGLDRFSVLFIGWFGPRGIASALYLLIAMSEISQPGFERAAAVVVVTIVLSTFLHGLTAVPLSKRFARSTQGNDPG